MSVATSDIIVTQPNIDFLKTLGLNLKRFISWVKENISKRCTYFFCREARSSRPEVFCKKGVLKYFAQFTGKHLCQSLFFNKVAGLRRNFQNQSSRSTLQKSCSEKYNQIHRKTNAMESLSVKF